MPKILRITTVPISLNLLLKGQLRFMASKGFEVVAVSSDGAEVEELIRREGVIHHVIPLTRQITPFKDLKALWATYRLILKLKPDIIHSHTPKAGLIAMVAGKLAGVKIRMHTIAGLPLLESTGLKRNLLEVIEKVTIWAAKHVYPNSYVMRDILIEQLKVSKDKLKVLGNGSSNGIDTGYFETSKEIKERGKALHESLGFSKGDIILTFVGRIVKDKGINELVQSFSELSQQHKMLKLLLVGPYEDNLDPISQKAREEIANNSNIVSTGFIKDIRPYLNISDIFVFPSYREGFPNVVMQALCMDLPCIVTNINGCNEIVQHEYNGLIVEPKNTDELKSSLNRLIVDKTLYDEIKKVSRKSIVDKYDQKLVWEAILSEYNDLMHV